MAITNNTNVQGMQHQYQHRYMHGKHQGFGKIMQSLSPEQREQISSLLQNLDKTQKQNLRQQLSQLDLSSMSSDELYQALLNAINNLSSSENISTSTGTTGSILSVTA